MALGGGSRARRLARNSILSFVGLAVPSLIGIVTIPRIVSGLGPERFGVLALVWMVLGYLGTFDLGMGRAVTRFVAQAVHEDDLRSIPRIVGTSFAVLVPFGMVTGALLAGLTPWITGHVLHLSGPLAYEMSGALYVLAIALPISQLSVLLRGVLEAFQRFDLVNAVKLPAGAASFVLPLLGIWLGLGLPAIVGLLLASRVVVLLAYLTLCRRLIPWWGPSSTAGPPFFRGLFAFGGWTTVSTLAQQGLSYVERFVLGHLLGIVSVTYYSAPLEAISRLSIVPISLATALFPDVSRGGRTSTLGPVMARSIKYLLLALVPGAGIATVFMVDLLTAWLGPDFVWAVRSSRILLLCFLLSAIGYVPLTVLYGRGRPRGKAILDLLELPLFGLLAATLIPPFGLEGAATARLIVQVVDMTALFVMVHHATGVGLRDLLTEGCGRVALLCAALAVGSALLLQHKPGPHLTLLLVAGGVVAFVVLVLRTALDERDWMLMPSVRSRLERLGLAKAVRDVGSAPIS
jgi:O-antigen/teichoic acid export membrane protein